jgi:hypothetical protein
LDDLFEVGDLPCVGDAVFSDVEGTAEGEGRVLVDLRPENRSFVDLEGEKLVSVLWKSKNQLEPTRFESQMLCVYGVVSSHLPCATEE